MHYPYPKPNSKPYPNPSTNPDPNPDRNTKTVGCIGYSGVKPKYSISGYSC